MQTYLFEFVYNKTTLCTSKPKTAKPKRLKCVTEFIFIIYIFCNCLPILYASVVFCYDFVLKNNKKKKIKKHVVKIKNVFQFMKNKLDPYIQSGNKCAFK